MTHLIMVSATALTHRLGVSSSQASSIKMLALGLKSFCRGAIRTYSSRSLASEDGAVTWAERFGGTAWKNGNEAGKAAVIDNANKMLYVAGDYHTGEDAPADFGEFDLWSRREDIFVMAV